MAFGLVHGASHYYEENSCRQQSRFEQRVLRVKISLIENFAMYTFLTVSKNYDKRVVMHISQVFVTVSYLHCRRVL